jgi:hypothetical protein
MSCRRARRQLLWLVRFGELGRESALHLDHLADCRACRDEVGFDRALVRELRVALAARVGDASPSPSAWEGIVARMRQPEPRSSSLRAWVLRLGGALRAGTAMAGASLALVLALHLEVVPVLPAATPGGEPADAAASPPAWAGEIPPFVDVAPPAGAAADAEDEAAAASVVLHPTVEAEQLPPGRHEVSGNAVARPAEADGMATEPAVVTGWQLLAVRLVPADAARLDAREAGTGEAEEKPEPVPSPALPGPS